MMRSALLWASRNTTMERVVRSSRAMRPLVSRFMPGETADEAMSAVRALNAEGTPSILTYLGENVNTDAAADQTVQEYEALFAKVRESGADVQVSIKLTQFGWDVDRKRALDRVRAMARLARDANTLLPIDMEGSPYVASTVDAYETLGREFDNVSLCLQAYLHRTPRDVQRLLSLPPSIRLVKGAYREPGTVALQTRPDIDARYRALGRQLLEASKNGARVVFGTHDLGLIAQLREDARAVGVAESSLEVQMLYGIQDAGRRALARSGVRTRVLISYGRAWYPWFMRRLAEKPSNLLLVGRNVFGR
ncbi:MAG TPA: proline dehydrogenase family protein [Gemmatimonadaceae bacterium]|nr:proline dehydrogenase family protein [Gemmatimonadaceae bacterium]